MIPVTRSALGIEISSALSIIVSPGRFLVQKRLFFRNKNSNFDLII